MSDDSNIKIGRDALKVAARLAKEFDISQKLVVEQAIHEFYTRHIDGDSLPIHRMTLREKNAEYGKQPAQAPEK